MLKHAAFLLFSVVSGHLIELNCFHDRKFTGKEAILNAHDARDLLMNVGLLLLLLLVSQSNFLQFFFVGCNALFHLLLLFHVAVSL